MQTLTKEQRDHWESECHLVPKQVLRDLGYDFRPGSYFYGPSDQVEFMTGEGPINPNKTSKPNSVSNETRLDPNKQNRTM